MVDAYTVYMAEQIIEEIKPIEDPLILSIYLKAILAQRCRIGGAKEGTCKDCMFESRACREMYETNAYELRIFNNEEEL